MQLLNRIGRYLVAGTLLDHIAKGFIKLRKRIDYLLGIWARKLLFSKCEVVNNRIFIMTYDFQYSCNPAAIAAELIRRELPVEIYWAVKKESNLEEFPPEIKTVPYRSYTMYQVQATAKIWIDNAFNCIWDDMPKKKTQYYFNTWHGSMGIKRLTSNSNKLWLHRSKRANKRTDFMISNSQFENDVYTGTFWPNVPTLLYGHPRNDMLFHPEAFSAYRREICQLFDISVDDRIMLYAPTFRDDGDLSCFDVDYAALKQTLEQRFGGNWVIFVRLHYKNRKRDETFDKPWLKDGGIIPDMQKLLAVADAGITDYSSWAYDYLLTRRPLFLYAPDLEKYDSDRGFYYPLETTPFPVSKSNEQLQQSILNLDTEKYLKNCEAFLKEKGCVEDGHAAQRVVDQIVKQMGL
ncbi:MAG: CDP-glycerol glycerophosphotransferase family protein [Oscillospiraceae bacterium]|nr:CDP-glycerol glycerophosphotransferase family protein [Oscillospiraceae bacterium]